MKARHKIIRVTWLSAIATSSAFAQLSEDPSPTNNSLAQMPSLTLKDYHTPSHLGLNNSDSSTGLLRGILPHKLFEWPQIMRTTLPSTTSHGTDSVSRLGDLNVFDLLQLKGSKLELGLGPQITVPTIADSRLGTGNWQAGGAALGILPQSWGLVGGLVTYQHSFAGESGGPIQHNLQSQPFLIFNLTQGFYLRSTAVWNFNLHTQEYYIPVGLGAGKVWQFKSGKSINLFAEPQYTVLHEGVAPRWQFFTGLNFQFPLGARSKKDEFK